MAKIAASDLLSTRYKESRYISFMGNAVRTGLSACGYAEQLTPRLRAPDSKSSNEVYAGTVVLPDGQLRRRAFVKIFPPAVRGQLVYNEVAAHCLAQQCGLRSPFTFPCACHVSLLRKSIREKMVSADGSPFVLAVASLDGDQKALTQSGGTFTAKWADLMNWPQVANAAVFDELMGNDDRHIANLIRCGPHEYTLIDNERILFAEPWFHRDLAELVARRCDANVLADTIAEGTDEMARQRMISLAQGYVTTTLLHIPEACERIEQVCGAPSGTTSRLIEMLNRRRLLLRYLMQWHVQKGDLFQASTNR